jgi:hypothetical protein
MTEYIGKIWDVDSRIMKDYLVFDSREQVQTGDIIKLNDGMRGVLGVVSDSKKADVLFLTDLPMSSLEKRLGITTSHE